MVGLPHGGLDHVVARSLFVGRFGRRWWLPFLVGYLGLAAGVLFAWHVVPTVMLGVFLLLSIAHFGAEDAAVGGDTSVAALLAYGGVPVVVPALAHPGEVGRIFAVLTGSGGGHVLRLAEGPSAAIWLLSIGVVAWRRIRSTDRRRKGMIELGGAIVLFATATPLTAFAIYFAVVHTPRAFASLQKSLTVAERHRLVARSLPLAVAGILAGAALFLLRSTASVSDGLVSAIFFLLSALTMPHMWLSWLSGRRHQVIG